MAPFQKSALYEDSPGVREIAKKRSCGGRRGLREPMRGVDRLESGLFRIMRTHAFFREPAAWRFSIARPALMQQRKISRRFFSLPFPFFEMRLQEGATRPAVERQRTKGRGAPEKILSPGSLRLRLRLFHVQSSSESGRPCSSIRRTNRTFSTTRASASLEQPAPNPFELFRPFGSFVPLRTESRPWTAQPPASAASLQGALIRPPLHLESDVSDQASLRARPLDTTIQ